MSKYDSYIKQQVQTKEEKNKTKNDFERKKNIKKNKNNIKIQNAKQIKH